MVPSLTSLTYYISFLYLLVMWSLHLRKGAAAAVARCLRLGLVVYSTLHLVVLDLYQFESAQRQVPLEPGSVVNSSNMTTATLLAR